MGSSAVVSQVCFLHAVGYFGEGKMNKYDEDYRAAVMLCISAIEDLHHWAMSISHDEVEFAECETKEKLNNAWRAKTALQKAEEILAGFGFEQELG